MLDTRYSLTLPSETNKQMEVTGQMVYIDNDVHESDMHVDNLENVFQMCFPPSNQDMFQTVGEGNIHDSFKENNGKESVGFDTVALDIHENENDFILNGTVVACVEKNNGLHGNVENANESDQMISIPLDTLQSVEQLPPQEEEMDIELPTNTLILSSQYNIESPDIHPGEEINQLQTTAGVSSPVKKILLLQFAATWRTEQIFLLLHMRNWVSPIQVLI